MDKEKVCSPRDGLLNYRMTNNFIRRYFDMVEIHHMDRATAAEYVMLALVQSMDSLEKQCIEMKERSPHPLMVPFK